jgi:hypothetical protein
VRHGGLGGHGEVENQIAPHMIAAPAGLSTGALLGRRACRAMVGLVVGTHFVFFCGGRGAAGVGSPVGPYLFFCMLLMERPPGACA